MQQSSARPNAPGNGQSATYAEAARGNGKGKNNAYAPGNTQLIRQPGEVVPRESKQAYAPRMQSNQNAQGGQQSKQEPCGNQDSPKREEPRLKMLFVGPCFMCQGVGHRTSECPYVMYYWCRQRGHVARERSQRANLSCNK